LSKNRKRYSLAGEDGFAKTELKADDLFKDSSLPSDVGKA